MIYFNDENWPWYGYLSSFFLILGVTSIILAFWPGFVQLVKTKNTEGLPIKLFSLFLLTGVLMSTGAIAGVCKKPEWKHLYFKGWWYVLMNTFVMFTNLYTVGLWVINQWKKRKLSTPPSDFRELIEEEINLLDSEDTQNTEDTNIDVTEETEQVEAEDEEKLNEEELGEVNLEGAI